MIGELEYEDMFQSKEKGLNLEIIRVISLIFYARFLIIMHHPYQFTGKQVEQSSDNRCVLRRTARVLVFESSFKLAYCLIPDAIWFDFGLFLRNSTRV